MLIAGNWKLNCDIEEAKDLSTSILNNLRDKALSSEVALFPPNIYIDTVKKIVNNSNIFIGAQDCSVHTSGAYTGDVSAKMLNDMECKYIIVGHSERRIGKFETNNDVALKAKNVMENKMCPIICVGEDAKDRDDGNALNFIEKQLNESIPKNYYKDFIIAYEPIWAIGSGKIPTIDSINEMFNMIRQWLLNNGIDNNIKILYGGSVNKENVKEIFSCRDLGGLLIGGVSLKAQEFSEICILAG
ncbi:MAG: triose-phosphate isomerase [Alphaproteobacteria bacterium]|nr:triose-phosphate isomerase [Alphaproteobacteria bacterium]